MPAALLQLRFLCCDSVAWGYESHSDDVQVNAHMHSLRLTIHNIMHSSSSSLGWTCASPTWTLILVHEPCLSVCNFKTLLTDRSHLPLWWLHQEQTLSRRQPMNRLLATSLWETTLYFFDGYSKDTLSGRHLMNSLPLRWLQQEKGRWSLMNLPIQ